MTLVFVKYFLGCRTSGQINRVTTWNHQSLKWLPPGETVIRFLESVMLLQDLQTYRGEVSWKFSIQLHQHTAPCTGPLQTLARRVVFLLFRKMVTLAMRIQVFITAWAMALTGLGVGKRGLASFWGLKHQNSCAHTSKWKLSQMTKNKK